MSGDRIDPAAFRAAYNALMPHLPHAQIRARVAELVAAAVVEKRTAHGVGYMQALVDSADERAHIRLAVHLDSGGTAKALDAAVQAAARALATGDEGSPYHFDSQEL